MHNSQQLYLRPDIQVDPLIHDWYAWVQIIPPAPAAFNVLDRQIKAMKSFICSPELHVEALKNPAMRGGPFIDLAAGAVPAVKALLERMQVGTSHQVGFVEAVRTLDLLLEVEGDGSSLQDMYCKIPASLRGYVELVYDRHHRADFRIFEALLYSSALYDESAQSISLSLFQGDDTRPFIFSTPRLMNDRSVRLPMPFRSSALDALFSMKEKSSTFKKIEDVLGIELKNPTLWRTLFTEQPPSTRAPYHNEQPRIRYFGHACVLVEANGLSVLIDPLLPYPGEGTLPRFSYADLPPYIDYVLITHGHHDHIMLETLLQLRHKIGTIVVPKNAAGSIHDPSLMLMLRQLGFMRVMEADEFGEIDLPMGGITALPFMGEHHDLQVHSKLCYHLRLGKHTVLFASDSCNFDHQVYERCHQALGNVDVLFIGMECDGAPVSWVYGPLFTKKLVREKDYSRRGRGSNSQEALSLVERFQCKQVYVYAMGSEPWIRYILDVHYTDLSNPIVHANRLIDACRSMGVHAERLHGARDISLGLK